MIDFEKIGKRILEERKYLHKISQEKMAEDLGMLLMRFRSIIQEDIYRKRLSLNTCLKSIYM